MNGLPDAEARAAIRTALDETLIVEAAAGTGKTTEIVHRIVAVLASGKATVDSIVAVTFTAKAAGELKLRLRAELERKRASEATAETRLNLERALAQLEEARVSTIHAFCSDLLRERPVEAAVDTAFRIMDDREAELMFRAAFSRWFQKQLEAPREGLRRIVRRQSRASIAELLLGSARLLAEWRDYPALWRRAPFDRNQAVDRALAVVRSFAEISRQPLSTNDPLFRETEVLRRVLDDIDRVERVQARDYDAVEAALVQLAADRDFRRARSGRGDRYSAQVKRVDVVTAHAEVIAALDTFHDAADADLAPLLQRELLEAVTAYEELKRDAGTVDFSDQLLRARDLVRDRPDVRQEFQERFTHIFIDEFQDTNLLQAELLLLIAAKDPAAMNWRDAPIAPGKLFVVGDPKQSIYRFRRADVHVYEEVKRLLVARGGRCIQLTTNFRSVPQIQRVVNAAFEPLMTGETTGQAAYVPLRPYRSGYDGQPAVVILPVPRPYGVRDLTKTAIRASSPAATAAFINWLIRESGWTVEEDGKRVPVVARHVCILFKQYTDWRDDVTRPYIEALEARDIAYLLVRGRSLHNREEVMTLRSAVTALEYPDDELALYATLRGALFAIGDAELFEYRHRHGALNYFHIPDNVAPNLGAITEALTFLRELHGLRNYRPVAETVSRLFEHTRAQTAFVFRPSGEQVLANVLLVSEMARMYDNGRGLSFRGFVEQLHDDAERGIATEAPTLEEASDGVRLMTVHSAKGLEFPVVVLADPCARLRPNYVSRFIDSERHLCAFPLAFCTPLELLEQRDRELEDETAENVRITYVAATRARDLLVIPAAGDRPWDGWLSPFNGAIYPMDERRAASTPGIGCPPFGTDTVLERPDDAHAVPIVPGEHNFDGGEESYAVTWWDPAALDLNQQARFGLRQEQLLSKDVAPELLAEDLTRFERWNKEREALLARALKPSIDVFRATDFASTVATLSRAIAFVEIPADDSRPSGWRYGTLVHNILAVTPLDADEAALNDLAQAEGRILGATNEEILAAAQAVRRTLAHPILKRARAADQRDRVRREVPVAFSPADGVLVEGVVDLAFQEKDEWVIVDFKTDHDLERGRERYERQLDLYADAVEAATGCSTRAILLKV